MFQSTRPARGATVFFSWSRSSARFQSTRPARGATLVQRGHLHVVTRFQSTRPARGATVVDCSHRGRLKTFQSTRPARGATLRLDRVAPRQQRFNPRAPRGARPPPLPGRVGLLPVSIHAPRAGRDLKAITLSSMMRLFQSTRPARGATKVVRFMRNSLRSCFNPRAPRGARPYCSCCCQHGTPVSIHAPRAGRDPASSPAICHLLLFQSTRPARGATPLLPISLTAKPATRLFRALAFSSPPSSSPSAPSLANPNQPQHITNPRTSQAFSVSIRSASHDQRPLRIIRPVHPNPLHPPLPVPSQKVESQAVL